MTSILDQVLDATTAGACVVAEQHNPNAINFVAGLSDPGEMIACGYRPELRRHPGEADAEYADRIRPLVMALPQKERDVIMGAAVRRASLDVSNGRVSVAVAGQAAWHGLGVRVDQAMTSKEARQLANMEWQVKKMPLTYLNPVTGQRSFAPGEYGLVREDTGAFLARVGSAYKPIQFEDGFDFLDSVVGKYRARYETAGVIHGGKKCWMLIHMPEQRFAVNGSDTVEPYVLFSNSHGDEAACCFPTAERTVCANTFRTALAGRKGKGLSIRHTGDVKGKVKAAQEALGLAVKGFVAFKEAAETLTTVKVNVRQYAGDVLDEVITYTEAEQSIRDGRPLDALLRATEAERRVVEKTVERKEKRHASLLADILDRYESRTNGVNGMRGTAWAAFNAVTEHADHYQPRSRLDRQERAERRFESVVAGEADDLKQVAYQLATAALN